MSKLDAIHEKVVTTLQKEYGISVEDAIDAANAGAYFMSVDAIGRRAEALWKIMHVSIPMTTNMANTAYKSGARWAVAHQSAS